MSDDQINMEESIEALIKLELLEEDGENIKFTKAGAQAFLVLSKLAQDMETPQETLARALRGEG